MKKFMANLALTGSLLVSAAVLMPLFQQSHPKGLGQSGVSLLLTPVTNPTSFDPPEVIARADLTMGLLDPTMNPTCPRSGWAKDLICTLFGP